jgi:DnaJ-class molecular chaperone
MKKVSWATEEVCPNCDGRWKVSQQTQTPFGVMQTSSACKQCGW